MARTLWDAMLEDDQMIRDGIVVDHKTDFSDWASTNGERGMHIVTDLRRYHVQLVECVVQFQQTSHADHAAKLWKFLPNLNYERVGAS